MWTHLGRTATPRSGTATGPVSVLGWTDANAAARRPRRRRTRCSRYLAHHPATARRIARKLAVKFVSDDPPQALVDRLAQVYLDNDTAIKPVLRALVDSPEFRGQRGPEGARPRRGRRGGLPAAGGHGSPAPTGDQQRGQRRPVAGRRARERCRSPGRGPTASRPTRAWSSPARLLASMRAHCVAVRRLVALAGRPLPLGPVVGAALPDALRPARRPPVRRCCSTVRRPPRCCRRAARRPTSGRGSGSPATTRWSRWKMNRGCCDLPRLPRLLPPVTP